MEETTILKENAMSGKERITFIKDINNCNLENLRRIQMAINFWCWKRGNKNILNINFLLMFYYPSRSHANYKNWSLLKLQWLNTENLFKPQERRKPVKNYSKEGNLILKPEQISTSLVLGNDKWLILFIYFKYVQEQQYKSWK